MSREFKMDTTTFAESGHILGGYLAVGMPAIRAISYVLKSASGGVVLEIVGEYDRPAE